MNLLEVSNNSIDILKKHSPKILLIGGIGLGVLAVAGSGVASFKASEIVNDIHNDPTIRSKRDLAKAYATRIIPLYIPVAILEAGSVVCLVKSYDISAKRLAAATALAEVSVETLRLYREKAKKVIGEEKVKEIEKEVREEEKSKDDESRKAKSKDDEHFYNFDVQWFHDTLSNKDFLSTVNDITRANLEFAERLNSEMQMSLNDWLYILKQHSIWIDNKPQIEPIEDGETVGWVMGQTVHVYTDKVGKTDVGSHPCIMLTYSTRPFESYKRI